jgi:hypothetical protein
MSHLFPLHTMFCILPVLALIFMTPPRGRRPSPPTTTTHSRVVRAVKVATDFYISFVPVDAQITMDALERETRMVRDFKYDDEVEAEVGGIVLNVGCTRSRNFIFFRTVELYLHTKTLVALGLLWGCSLKMRTSGSLRA